MIEKCLGSLREWNEKRQIRNVCDGSVVSLRKSNGEMVLIYDGCSKGYKSDDKVDVGEKVFNEIKGEKDDCKLILRPNVMNRKDLNFDENILPIRIVPLKLRKH